MNETAKELCKKIQGAQLAFLQSDEISILVNNYKELSSEPWYNNSVQKITSISAALASVTFTMNSDKIFGKIVPAYFDSRVFIIPKEEVNNSFIFRQNDCRRNSISMMARSLYSHKECNNKNSNELKKMIMNKGQSWDDAPNFHKNGRCIIKKEIPGHSKNKKTGEEVSFIRNEWIVDNHIPLFTDEPNYIEKFI